MRTPTPFPQQLRGRSFGIAEAVALGCTPGRLRHPGLQRPYRGMRVAGGTGTSLHERAVAYLPLLRPGERFSHATALVLYGCPIRVPRGHAVDVEAALGSSQVRRSGISGHRRTSERLGVRLCGIPGSAPGAAFAVVGPLRAVLQAATQLPFSELVVALDHLLRINYRDPEWRPWVTPEELAEFAHDATGRGVRRFREAAELARVGAESRMETLNRLAGVRIGLPELTLQLNIYDADGKWIGRFDMVDQQTRTIYEYDGEQHRKDRAQYLRDIVRLESARNAGWRVMRAHKEDFGQPLLVLGRRMASFAGRAERAIRIPLARLLDERSYSGFEPASPRAGASPAE